MQDVVERKKEMRAAIRRERALLTEEQQQQMSDEILQRLRAMPVYQNAKRLLLYISMPGEVATEKLIETAIKDGKEVAAPYCIKEGRKLVFYSITGLQDTRPGAYNIPEPDIDRLSPVEEFDDTICIVPAMSFDRLFYRLGYGGGYYDRFLERFPGATIGLIYDQFLVPEVPRDQYDKMMDYIITQTSVKERKPR